MLTLAKPRALVQGDHAAAFHAFRSTSLLREGSVGAAPILEEKKRVAVLDSDIRLWVRTNTWEWGESIPSQATAKEKLYPKAQAPVF